MCPQPRERKASFFPRRKRKSTSTNVDPRKDEDGNLATGVSNKHRP